MRSKSTEKAELLCEASGVKLGQLLTINYNWSELNIYSDSTYDLLPSFLREEPIKARHIEIEPDDIDVKDNAVFVWEIE